MEAVPEVAVHHILKEVPGDAVEDLAVVGRHNLVVPDGAVEDLVVVGRHN